MYTFNRGSNRGWADIQGKPLLLFLRVHFQVKYENCITNLANKKYEKERKQFVLLLDKEVGKLT